MLTDIRYTFLGGNIFFDILQNRDGRNATRQDGFTKSLLTLNNKLTC